MLQLCLRKRPVAMKRKKLHKICIILQAKVIGFSRSHFLSSFSERKKWIIETTKTTWWISTKDEANEDKHRMTKWTEEKTKKGCDDFKRRKKTRSFRLRAFLHIAIFSFFFLYFSGRMIFKRLRSCCYLNMHSNSLLDEIWRTANAIAMRPE